MQVCGKVFFFFFFEELQCHKDTPHGCSVDLKNKTKQNKQKSKKVTRILVCYVHLGVHIPFFPI
jgi:hypothetical protein